MRAVKRWSLLAAFLPLLCAGPALAHERSGELPADPWLSLPLLLTGCLYLAGQLRLASLRRRRRQDHQYRQRFRYGRALLFGAGWLMLALPIATPLHVLGERSFTAHMVEHEIIMIVAAPLLAASRPLGILLWSLPARARRALVRLGRRGGLRQGWAFMTSATVATVIQALVLWLWHLPAAFETALASPAAHAAQHVSFLASAVLFWWSMGRRAKYGEAAFCQFLTLLQTGMLGALMSFSTGIWYRGYSEGLDGLTALEDQQLAGLIMWIPAGMVHAGAAMLLIAALLRTAGGRRHVQMAD
jgi:putative membrane protein